MKRILSYAKTPHGGARIGAALTLLLLLPLWLCLGNWYQTSLVQQERADASAQISARAKSLVFAVNQRIALLQGLYAFTRTEWPGTDFDFPFEVFSSDLYFNSTGLRTLMIAPEGIARYVYPLYDARTLSGYDVINDPSPATRADIQRAIHTREITLSQPGELPQGGFGLIAWRAVFRGSDLWGLVSVSLDLPTILAESGFNEPLSGLELGLRDDAGHTFFGSADVWQRDPVVQKINLPEGGWDLGGAPKGDWVAPILSQVTWFRAGSLLIVVLLAGIVFLTVNRQGQLAQAVADRTHQIAIAQQELELRVDERTRELFTLLQISRRVASRLALEPLLVNILDEMKNVLDFDAASILRLNEAGQLTLLTQAGRGNLAGFSPLKQPYAIEVVASRQPLILPECEQGENQAKYCWLGVPLVVKDHVIGVLTLVHREPHFYQDDIANLALAFAQNAAVAIENARLYEQAGQLAVLEERQRLARELHDSVSQVLYSIGLGVKSARAALEKSPALALEALEYIGRLAEGGQVEMRALIFELRPESLRTDGLVVALQRQAAVLRARYQINVQTHFCSEPPVPLKIKEDLYRVAQEATHNIIKHAHATQTTLILECTDGEIRLAVCDNGIGFDPETDYPGHLGLQSMRERAAKNNGRIQIDSAPGQGTRIEFIVSFGAGA